MKLKTDYEILNMKRTKRETNDEHKILFRVCEVNE